MPRPIANDGTWITMEREDGTTFRIPAAMGLVPEPPPAYVPAGGAEAIPTEPVASQVPPELGLGQGVEPPLSPTPQPAVPDAPPAYVPTGSEPGGLALGATPPEGPQPDPDPEFQLDPEDEFSEEHQRLSEAQSLIPSYRPEELIAGGTVRGLAAEREIGRIGSEAAQKEAKIREEGVAEAEKIKDSFRGKLDKVNTDIDAETTVLKGMVEEFRNMPRQSAWESAGAGKKALGIISVAIGGFLADRYGGKNYALEVLGNMIEKDMASKRMALDAYLKGMKSQDNLLIQNYKRLGSIQHAEAVTLEQMAVEVVDKINTVKAQATSDIKIQEAEKLTAGMLMGLGQSINTLQEQERSRRVEALELAQNRQIAHANILQRERESKRSAWTQRSIAKDNLKFKRDQLEAQKVAASAELEAKRGVRALIGRDAFFLGTSKYTEEGVIVKQQDSLKAQTELRRMFGELHSLMTTSGRVYQGPGGEWKFHKDDDRIRAESLHKKIVAAMARAEQGAKISDKDLEFYEAILGGGLQSFMQVGDPRVVVVDLTKRSEESIRDSINSWTDPTDPNREKRISAYINYLRDEQGLYDAKLAAETGEEEAAMGLREAEREAEYKESFIPDPESKTGKILLSEPHGKVVERAKDLAEEALRSPRPLKSTAWDELKEGYKRTSNPEYLRQMTRVKTTFQKKREVMGRGKKKRWGE